jgi:hypothetical protein
LRGFEMSRADIAPRSGVHAAPLQVGQEPRAEIGLGSEHVSVDIDNHIIESEQPP